MVGLWLFNQSPTSYVPSMSLDQDSSRCEETEGHQRYTEGGVWADADVTGHWQSADLDVSDLKVAQHGVGSIGRCDDKRATGVVKRNS